MGNYKNYLDKLKGYQKDADYNAMYEKIEKRLTAPPKIRTGLAMSGALGILIMVIAAYFTFLSKPSPDDSILMGYVFSNGELTGDIVVDYVFSD